MCALISHLWKRKGKTGIRVLYMSICFVEMHSVLMDTEKRVEGATSNYSYLVTPRGQVW